MNKSVHQDRVFALRAAMAAHHVDGFIIPRADEYQGEYVPDSADRLRWLTGFTGSAGYSVVLKDKAGVFSDGRYTIQLRQQIDGAVFETGDSTKINAAEWIFANTSRDAVIGYDPRLHTPRELKAFEDRQIAMKALPSNLVDSIWEGRPAAPASTVSAFPLSSAGVNVQDKLDLVADRLKEKKVQAAILSLPDSIAWLLNIRADDIPHIPVALSYAIVCDDATLDWFIDEGRVSDGVRMTFGNRVSFVAPELLEKSIAALKGKKTLVDERRISVWFMDQLRGADIETIDSKDPCIALKARKNQAEIESMRAAHIRDGVSVTKFLSWFAEAGPKGDLTEIDIERKLEDFRRSSPLYRDSSFDTIAGYGANGAIVHYRATAETAKTIMPGNMLLLDSGAQYEDGTTDITRTVAVGQPTPDMKRHFTLVLKGHIALATARFPAGTTGAQVDVYARSPLWQAGLDYAHGTGHGVGVYLSVHEESASISPRGLDPLEEGMILSNEPGYYLEGEYGIRIENLVLVIKVGVCDDTGKDMLGFDTLTFAPIDPALVDFGLLTEGEKGWLRAYHEDIIHKIGPHLKEGERNFLTGISRLYT